MMCFRFCPTSLPPLTSTSSSTSATSDPPGGAFAGSGQRFRYVRTTLDRRVTQRRPRHLVRNRHRPSPCLPLSPEPLGLLRPPPAALAWSAGCPPPPPQSSSPTYLSRSTTCSSCRPGVFSTTSHRMCSAALLP
eukprot:2568279-Rhodomonas_salina.1